MQVTIQLNLSDDATYEDVVTALSFTASTLSDATEPMSAGIRLTVFSSNDEPLGSMWVAPEINDVRDMLHPDGPDYKIQGEEW
jgi:hypothetical protein